jgi:hypothetical protein
LLKAQPGPTLTIDNRHLLPVSAHVDSKN